MHTGVDRVSSWLCNGLNLTSKYGLLMSSVQQVRFATQHRTQVAVFEQLHVRAHCVLHFQVFPELHAPVLAVGFPLRNLVVFVVLVVHMGNKEIEFVRLSKPHAVKCLQEAGRQVDTSGGAPLRLVYFYCKF